MKEMEETKKETKKEDKAIKNNRKKFVGDKKGGQYEGGGDKKERSGYEGEGRCYRGRPRRR